MGPKLRIYAFALGAALHVGILLAYSNGFALLVFVLLVFPVLFFWDSTDRKSGYEYKLWGRLVPSRRRQYALRF